MATLTIRLPDAHRDRLAAMAAQRGLSMNKLMEELSVRALAEHDTEMRFRMRAARGDTGRGLKLLAELDRGHAQADLGGLVRLSIDMTWPIRATLLPRLVESVMKELELCQHDLREEHTRREHDHIRVFGMLDPHNRVPDKVKFYVEYDVDGHPRVIPVEGSLDLESGDTPLLLIVLESPHTCEYDGSVARPVGPARGTTGTNIESELGGLLHASRNLIGTVPCGTRVAVANPVQFQASLHAVHGGSLQKRGFAALRDAVWQCIWSLEEIRHDFGTRVRRFNPTWIINACTGGSYGWGKVNGAVSEWLLNAEIGCQIYATTHPALWQRSPPRLSSLSKVDLNHATADEMQRILIGVGAKVAERLVDARRIRPFQSTQDVRRRVDGIGSSFFMANNRRLRLEIFA